jgi:transposase
MQLTIQATSIFMYKQPVSFRKSIDGLLDVIFSETQLPMEDHVFVFFNKRRDKIKVLAWHKNGFVLLLKRLEQGNFFSCDGADSLYITPQQLSWLVAGLDWQMMSSWGELSYEDYR